MRRITLSLSLLLCVVCTVHLWGQNVSSALQGTVIDSTNAVVVGANVILSNQGTGGQRTGVTNAKGIFRFSELSPGTYSITVKMKGFKGYNLEKIVLVSSETRDLGNTQLEVGSATEQVTVNADITPVQTASSEKASTIDPNEMEHQAVRGRDMVAYMDLIPGLVDSPTTGTGAPTGRNVTSNQALAGVTINGADLGHINYTVDGVPAIDSSTQYLHYEPNVDSIQEMKVLTSNYQAEFGRNSGGTITIITKGGSKEFHGSGWFDHKHEQFNANTYFNNQSDLAKALYRYNVAGWSLGGPAYIPTKFNTKKNKLFFFATQEFTRQLVPASSGTTYATMPTAAELTGDFTNVINPSTGLAVPIYYNNNGTRTVITGCEADRLTTGSTCNIAAYKDSRGQAVLNWINSTRGASNDFTPGSSSEYYESANWATSGISGQHPRRNDMIRVDSNLTPNLSAYFRWIRDTDSQIKHEMESTWDVWPVKSPNPGHGYVGNVNWVINPTMVNELTIGKDWTAWGWEAIDPSSAEASIANLPLSYSIAFNTKVNGLQSVLPNIYFTNVISSGPGGGGGGGGTCSVTPCNPPQFNAFLWDYYNTQNYWTVSDNLSKAIGTHSLKAGLYLEKQNKIQPGVQNYNGKYAFGANTQLNSIYDAGDGYANAYMGNFAAYQQASGRTVADVNFWNVEWYVQDNWRVNKRLTLDIGVRFYHPTPYVDNANTISYFDPDSWLDANKPEIQSDGTLTCTGQGSGCSTTNGMVVNGNPYSTKWLTVAPRLGFALDLFGNGKTAIRGGFGVFPNRESGQLFNGSSGMVMSGQAPVINTASLTWNTLNNLSTLTSPVSPVAVTSWTGKTPISKAFNASFGVQQNIGYNMVFDVSYVGAWAQNQPLAVNINPVPLWSCYNCGTAAQNVLRPYYGYQDVDMEEFIGYNNYHSLQSTLQRRFSGGLMIGVAYTMSKQLSLGSDDQLLSPSVNRERNYGGGPIGHNVMINYSYDLPNLSKKLSNQPGKALVGAVTDHWALSGITHLASGSAYTVGCSVNGNYDATGTPSEATRCDQLSNPTNGRGKLAFNPAAYTIAAAHTLGNAPQNNLVGPGIENFDVTLRKSIPLGGERRKLKLEAQAFNVFNHAQFKGVNSNLTFSCSGTTSSTTGCSTGWELVTTSISSTGTPGSGIGSYSSSSGTQEARIIGFNARIEF
jgi:hypothetical protein